MVGRLYKVFRTVLLLLHVLFWGLLVTIVAISEGDIGGGDEFITHEWSV